MVGPSRSWETEAGISASQLPSALSRRLTKNLTVIRFLAAQR